MAAKYFISIFALVVLHSCGPEDFHTVLCTYVLCQCQCVVAVVSSLDVPVFIIVCSLCTLFLFFVKQIVNQKLCVAAVFTLVACLKFSVQHTSWFLCILRTLAYISATESISVSSTTFM